MYIYCPGGIQSGTSCTRTDPSIQATCVGEGDLFVKRLVPEIMNTQTWKSGSTVIFLTWDEPTFASSTQCPGYNPSAPYPSEPCQIPGIWIGPSIKQHYSSNMFTTHFSVLTTLEQVWGLAPLTKSDAQANPMTEFFNLPPPDFRLSANQNGVAAYAGATANAIITMSSWNGFTGTVTLASKPNSTNLACTLSPTTITGPSGSSTLNCRGSVAGNYLANVTGTSGTISHSVGVTYHVYPTPPDGPLAYIVVIVLENQGLSHVYGSGCSSTDCTYITQLANTYGIALDYSGVGHHSLVNYLTLTSGGNYSDYTGSCSSSPNHFGCDCSPSNCQVSGTVTNLVDTLQTSRKTWKAYMEDYNSVPGCYLSDGTAGRRYNSTDPGTEYNSAHNPFVYYPDINSNVTRCLNIVDANGSSTGYFAGPNGGLPNALLSDLNGQSPPNLMWLTPNGCNDGRDHGTSECPVSDPVLEQNNYLQALVPAILNSNTFKTKPSALLITWDEGVSCAVPGQTFPTCPDPIATIWAGPSVTLGYQSSIPYSHYSFITTLENIWSLNLLPIPPSVSAPVMTQFFTLPSPTPTAGGGGGRPPLRT
jgi:hypothetical protein